MKKQFTQNFSQNLSIRKMLIAATFLFSVFVNSQAALYWFGNGADTNWSTLTGNWSTTSSPTFTQAAALPTTTDDVVILDNTTVNITSDVFTINSLTLNVGSTVEVASGGKIKISRTNNSGNMCTISGGTINNSGIIEMTSSVALTGTNFGLVLNDPSNAPTNTTANSTFYNKTGGALSITMYTGSTTNPLRFRQISSNRTGGGLLFKVDAGSTTNLIPVAGSDVNRNVVFMVNSTYANIDGTGTITAGTQASPVGYGLINYTPANGGSSGIEHKLTIASGVTLNSYITSPFTGASVLLNSGSFTSNTVFQPATLINNGTINMGGSGSAGIAVSPVSGQTVPCTLTNAGTLNFNGAFTTAALNISANGTGSNTITNSGTINYNTTTNNTVSVPFYKGTSSAKMSITNSGTITVGSNTALTTAMDINSGLTTFTNSGVLNIGSGSIVANGGSASTSVPAILNNNSGATINFTSTTATTTLISNKVSLVNNGTINTATTTNAVTLNSGVQGTTNGVSFGTTNVLNPGGTATGICTLTNSVTLQGAVNMDVANMSGVAGTDYDQIVSTTASSVITLGGTLALNITSSVPANGTVITLIASNGTSGSITGTFASVTGLPNSNWLIGYTTKEVTLTYSGTTDLSVMEAGRNIFTSNKNGIISKLTGNIQVFSLNGKMIKSQDVTDGQFINLVQGAYIVKAKSGNNEIRVKVII